MLRNSSVICLPSKIWFLRALILGAWFLGDRMAYGPLFLSWQTLKRDSSNLSLCVVCVCFMSLNFRPILHKRLLIGLYAFPHPKAPPSQCIIISSCVTNQKKLPQTHTYQGMRTMSKRLKASKKVKFKTNTRQVLWYSRSGC